jgi:hypothetical protein
MTRLNRQPVRSARRRQPALSRILSRCEPILRTLMNSRSAICAFRSLYKVLTSSRWILVISSSL